MAQRGRFARILLVLFIAVPLCVSSAWGAPRRLSLGIQPLDAIVRLWNVLTASWSESGCGIDPHGECVAVQEEPPAPPPTTDSGCGIDPNGGCTPGS